MTQVVGVMIKARSLTWEEFDAYLRRWLPKARIVHDLYPVPWWQTQTGSRMV
jgi:hypothetical protein